MSLIKPLIWNELDHQGNQFVPCILYSITFGIRERALSEILNIYHLAWHQNDNLQWQQIWKGCDNQELWQKSLIHKWKRNKINFENRLGRICWNPEGLWSTRNLVNTADSTLPSIWEFVSRRNYNFHFNEKLEIFFQVYKLQCLISVLLLHEQLSLEEWVRWVKDIWYFFSQKDAFSNVNIKLKKEVNSEFKV